MVANTELENLAEISQIISVRSIATWITLGYLRFPACLLFAFSSLEKTCRAIFRAFSQGTPLAQDLAAIWRTCRHSAFCLYAAALFACPFRRSSLGTGIGTKGQCQSEVMYQVQAPNETCKLYIISLEIRKMMLKGPFHWQELEPGNTKRLGLASKVSASGAWCDDGPTLKDSATTHLTSATKQLKTKFPN